MNKISKIVITTLVLTGMSIIPANAGEDQATYAVVDSNGVVTNIIVCGPAVCGPTGSWGGTMPSDSPWAGQKLVLQVPVHTVTGQSLGGYLGTPENPVKYDAQAQVFTQGSASTPTPITRNEIVEQTTLTATIHSDVISFGPNNVVDNQMQLIPRVESTTAATITALQSTGETRTVTTDSGTVLTESVFTVETETFTNPKTRTQLKTAIENRLLIIQRYLSRFYILLNGWLID